ncbi:Protein of unknown function [Gryllus bimaculatus]|nr:Protein of unknown function [Gryllus bimaculatus]
MRVRGGGGGGSCVGEGGPRGAFRWLHRLQEVAPSGRPRRGRRGAHAGLRRPTQSASVRERALPIVRDPARGRSGPPTMAWWKKFITGNRTTSSSPHHSDQHDSDNELAHCTGDDSGTRTVCWSLNAGELCAENSDGRRSRSGSGSRRSALSRCSSESECALELVAGEARSPAADVMEFIAKCLPVVFWCVASCIFLLLGTLMLLVFTLALHIDDDNKQWVRAGRSGSNIVLGFGVVFFVLMFCTAVYVHYCRNDKIIREGVEHRAAPRSLRAAREHRLTPHPLLFQRTLLGARAQAHMELVQLEAGPGAGRGPGAGGAGRAAAELRDVREPASCAAARLQRRGARRWREPPAARRPKTYVRPWMPPPRSAPAAAATVSAPLPPGAAAGVAAAGRARFRSLPPRQPAPARAAERAA